MQARKECIVKCLPLIGVGVVVVVALLWKHDAGELQLIVHQGDLVTSEVMGDDMAGVLIIYSFK